MISAQTIADLQTEQRVTRPALRISERQEAGAAPRLTNQERRVLLLTFEGLTAKQIGELLYICDRTVTFHQQGAYEKLQAHSKMECLLRAIALGIITFEDLQAIAEKAFATSVEEAS